MSQAKPVSRMGPGAGQDQDAASGVPAFLRSQSRAPARVPVAAAAAAVRPAPAVAGGSSSAMPDFLRRAGAALSSAQAPKPPEPPTKMVGRLVRIRVYNDWAIGTIYIDGRGDVAVSGAQIAHLIEGVEYEFTGTWRDHAKHGRSLEVLDAAPSLAIDREAMTRFIVTVFKGIGRVRAENYLRAIEKNEGDAGLERVRQTLVTAPHLLDLRSVSDSARYVGPAMDEQSDAATLAREGAIYRDLSTTFGATQGVRAPTLRALAKWLQERTREHDGDPVQLAKALLTRNPYEAIADVEGYGFAMADAIGRACNFPLNAPERLRALVSHALDEGCERDGHVFLDLAQLVRSIGRVDSAVDALNALDVAKQASVVSEDEQGRYYPVAALRAERGFAAAVAALTTKTKPLMRMDSAQLLGRIDRAARECGFADGLDASQRQAVLRILSSDVRIHTLTGGPGCGKTSVMQVLASVARGRRFVFATPTGKAAKVLSSRLERLGHQAATIHSTLGGSDPGSFHRNQSDPLDADIVVVDEFTMVDLKLARALAAALARGAHLIVLGDPGQLPSIGAGQVLVDLLQITGVDHNRLDTVHRNSGGILELVSSIATGNIDVTEKDAVKWSRGLGEARDGMQAVVARYLDGVARHGIAQTVLLMSRRQGDVNEPGWNTTYANALLRGICNPHGQRIPGTNFHNGDRVIVRANCELPRRGQDGKPEDGGGDRVVNGDTGTISNVILPNAGSRFAQAEWVDVTLDDGRTVNLKGGTTSILDHAYALTVHSAQGSEYADVIFVATPGMPTFVNRNMLFTAVSRAKQSLQIFGDDATLRRIAATPMPPRNTALQERVALAREATARGEEPHVEDGADDKHLSDSDNDDDEDAPSMRRSALPMPG